MNTNDKNNEKEQDRGVPSIRSSSPIKKNVIAMFAIALVSVVAVNASLKNRETEDDKLTVDERYGTGVQALPGAQINNPNELPNAFVLPNTEKSKNNPNNTYNYYTTNKGDQYNKSNSSDQRRSIDKLNPRIEPSKDKNTKTELIYKKRKEIADLKQQQLSEERWKRRQASPLLFESGRAGAHQANQASSDPFSSQMDQLNRELSALTNGMPQTPDMNDVMKRMMPGGGQGSRAGGNQAFAERVSNQIVETATAMPMGDLEFKIVQGKVIPCTLETAVDSSLPGMVRCVVSKDVYGESGRTVLIPRGGRIVGQYNSAIKNGQYRVFVVWSRVITNDYDIAIGSPGTDNLGRAGSIGDVDSHFWSRFGNATLLSLLGAGTASYGNDGELNAGNAYRQTIANSFADQANSNLAENISIPDTIHKDQGEKVKIMAAKDLDFTLVMKFLSLR